MTMDLVTGRHLVAFYEDDPIEIEDGEPGPEADDFQAPRFDELQADGTVELVSEPQPCGCVEVVFQELATGQFLWSYTRYCRSCDEEVVI